VGIGPLPPPGPPQAEAAFPELGRVRILDGKGSLVAEVPVERG
jgi:hypothetical protein